MKFIQLNIEILGFPLYVSSEAPLHSINERILKLVKDSRSYNEKPAKDEGFDFNSLFGSLKK